jgi:hypothetical protein
MGYNHRNDEIHYNIVRMQREWEAHGTRWRPCAASMRGFRPRAPHGSGRRLLPRSPQNITGWSLHATVAGLWSILDLRVKPRDPEASVRVALRDVRLWARSPAHRRFVASPVDLNCVRSGTPSLHSGFLSLAVGGRRWTIM